MKENKKKCVTVRQRNKEGLLNNIMSRNVKDDESSRYFSHSLSMFILLALLNVRKSVVLVVSVCNRQNATLFSVLKFILGTQREAHKKWNKNKTQNKSPLTQHDTKRSGNERETLRNTKRRSKKSNRLSLRDNAHESMWHINIACWIL